MNEYGIPKRAIAYQGRLAGVVTRLIAGSIDYGIVAVLTIAANIGAGLLLFLFNPTNFDWPNWPFGAYLLIGFTLLIGLLTIGWATTGRTPGASLLGVKVVDRGGNTPSWPLAFVRALACAIFPIGVFLAVVSTHNRSVQDLVLRTSVVYDWARVASLPRAEEFAPPD